MFLDTAIWFFVSLVIVVACYRAMERVTAGNKRLELYVNHDCVFVNASLHCYTAFELWELSDFLPLFTAVHQLYFLV